jgi:hypothetical protein
MYNNIFKSIKLLVHLTGGQSSKGMPIAVPGGGGSVGIIGDTGDPDPCCIFFNCFAIRFFQVLVDLGDCGCDPWHGLRSGFRVFVIGESPVGERFLNAANLRMPLVLPGDMLKH